MELKTVMLTISLLLITAYGHAEFDYLRAADGVSFTHAHIQRTGGELVDDPNSKTGSSWINTKLSNVEETNQIPLEKGHGFNIQLLLFKLPPETASIDVTMTHPAMQLPSGELLKEQSGSIPTEVSMGFPEVSFSYTLDEDYELVEGDWVVTFSHQGEELFHITFTTYEPVVPANDHYSTGTAVGSIQSLSSYPQLSLLQVGL